MTKIFFVLNYLGVCSIVSQKYLSQNTRRFGKFRKAETEV